MSRELDGLTAKIPLFTEDVAWERDVEIVAVGSFACLDIGRLKSRNST